MLPYVLTWLHTLQHENAREDGQDLAEYALLIALIALAVIAAITALSGQISGVFEAIGNKLGASV